MNPTYEESADATRVAPWPYPAQTLFSCDQQAGDVMLVPEMWAHATMSDEPSVVLWCASLKEVPSDVV